MDLLLMVENRMELLRMAESSNWLFLLVEDQMELLLLV
jgi:hypothetical protein